MGRRSVSILAMAALVSGLIASPVAAADTTGSWTQYPSGGLEYQAEIQQPINLNNTSNWTSKSKGAVPVMFKLSSRRGQAVFESIGSDGSTANDFAYATFTPTDGSMTFSDITNLSTNYEFTLGNCFVGSLRWTVTVMHAGNVERVHVYYGDPGGVQDCISNNGSGVNLITTTANPDRFEMQGGFGGGPVYTTYDATNAVVGDDVVLRASLIIDSGWQDDQRLTISNTTVNDNVYQWDAGGSGAFTPTCNLPAATIDVTKIAPTPDGSINEQPVQGSLADSGNAFRVVDCKYQYNLAIPSLKGMGTYRVEIKINGTSVPTPTSSGGQVRFDLK